jgi:hypothetical protein
VEPAAASGEREQGIGVEGTAQDAQRISNSLPLPRSGRLFALTPSSRVACGAAQDRERIVRHHIRIRHAGEPISAIGTAELTAVLAWG